MKTWTLFATAALAAAGMAAANPVTQPNTQFQSIGGGLLVRSDDGVAGDESGNITIPIYTRHGIFLADHYVLDPLGNLRYLVIFDGGGLGVLLRDRVTLDCKNQTFSSFSTDGGPEIWRAKTVEPLLESVFHYVCSRNWNLAASGIQ